jgi:hypothetical protein
MLLLIITFHLSINSYILCRNSLLSWYGSLLFHNQANQCKGTQAALVPTQEHNQAMEAISKLATCDLMKQQQRQQIRSSLLATPAVLGEINFPFNGT